MSALKPLYRLTIFSPFSEDPTETSVIAPIGGAAHADPFVVTTMQGVTGAKPYLGMPTGRAGSLDYTSKKTTTGNRTLSVFDPRVTAGGSNASRWSTAFLGDSLGRTRLKGCKWTLERSLDGTVGSLVPFDAGRIRNQSVKRPQWLDLDTVDFADDLNRPLFTGAPHSSISYAALASVLPHGVVAPFANLPLTPPLAATVYASTAPFINDPIPNTLVIGLTAPSSPAAMITQAVADSESSTVLRLVRLTKVSDGTVHYYQWPRGAYKINTTFITGGPVTHFGQTAFPIAVLPATDARTEALPAVGIAVTVSVMLDAPPTPAVPILVNDVHPVQYLADLLDGKFSCAPGTTTLRPLAVRNSGGGGSWATLIADPSFGTMREIIEQYEPKANDYIEKVLLPRYNLALVRDASGHLDVVDLRRSASLAGAVTLTDDDLVTDVDPAWDDSRDGAVTAVEIEYWVDTQVPVAGLTSSGDKYPTDAASLISSTKSSLVVLNDLSTLKDVGQKIVTIAARGDRISNGETSADWATAHAGRLRQHYIEAQLTAAANDFLRPLGSGTITAKATYRLASTNVASIGVGKYCIVQHTKLPDPASNTRGGARLMLCLARDDTNERTAVTWLDAGIGSVAVAPSITGVTSADAYSVDATVAANGAGDPMEVYVAVTDTSVGTHPADNAAEWLFATQTGAGTVHIGNLPPSKRIWVRARSYGNAPNTKLPSVWVYSAHLDLASGTAVDLSPPSAPWTPIGEGPSLDVSKASGTSADTITYAASGGTLTLKINGTTSSVPASPIIVSRPAVGGVPLDYSFSITDGVVTRSSTVTVQPIGATDTNTVTPVLRDNPFSTSDTVVWFKPSFGNPSGGVAPTCTVELKGVTATIAGVGKADGSVTTIASNADVQVDRPTFGGANTGNQPSVVFHATIAGGGDAQITRTILNQVKTSFGGSLSLAVTPGPTSYSIAYTATGTVELSIDGGTYTAAPASPITVTLTSSPHTYDFRVTLDGQTSPGHVDIPALVGVGGTTPAFSSIGTTPWTSAAYSGAGTTTIRAQWAMSAPPTGVSYDLIFEEQVTAADYAMQRVYGVTSPYDFTTSQIFKASGATARNVRLTVQAVVSDTLSAQSRTDENTLQVL